MPQQKINSLLEKIGTNLRIASSDLEIKLMENEDKEMGNITFSLDDNCCEIIGINVNEGFQNRGIGSILLYSLVLKLQELDIPSIKLIPVGTGSRIFYQNNGFIENDICEMSFNLKNQKMMETLENHVDSLTSNKKPEKRKGYHLDNKKTQLFTLFNEDDVNSNSVKVDPELNNINDLKHTSFTNLTHEAELEFSNFISQLSDVNENKRPKNF